MNWQFQYKEFVWLFVAIAVLVIFFILLLRWKRNVFKKMGDPQLIQSLLSPFSPFRFSSKYIIILIALTAGIIACMNPREPREKTNSGKKGIDLAIALDVSNSMLATDLAPNRLERAKQMVIKLIDAMPDDRIALVVFAGKSYLQMPLTADHGAAKLFVNAASPAIISQQGTVIGDALKMSASVFDAADKRFKAVVLLSDGEDHDADALLTARELAQQGVMINTVGIGSAEGATIPDLLTGENKKDAAGNTVVSILNEEILQSVAQYTNGIYLRLTNSETAIDGLKKQLAQIERKAYGDVSQMNFKNYYSWFVTIMLLLLLAENFIPETRKLRIV